MRKIALLAFVAAVGFTAACESSSGPDRIVYRATLTGAAEVPANQSAGTGTWIGTLNTETNILSYNLSWSGLGSNTTLAHIHGPGSATAIANVLVDFDLQGALQLGQTSGTGSGSITLTSATQITGTVTGDSLRKLFDAGQSYVNVHSVLIGGGEIRGQITRQ